MVNSILNSVLKLELRIGYWLFPVPIPYIWIIIIGELAIQQTYSTNISSWTIPHVCFLPNRNFILDAYDSYELGIHNLWFNFVQNFFHSIPYWTSSSFYLFIMLTAILT